MFCMDSNKPSKIFYVWIGSEVLCIARTTTDLINMVIPVNILLKRWESECTHNFIIEKHNWEIAIYFFLCLMHYTLLSILVVSSYIWLCYFCILLWLLFCFLFVVLYMWFILVYVSSNYAVLCSISFIILIRSDLI